MKTPSPHRGGFTLVELLVVIAIIGILAAFLATALPKVLERAKVADVANTMNQLRTSLVTYYTDDKSSFPPAYGYIVGEDPATGDPIFNRRSWMSYIGEFSDDNLLDRFSITDDTDGDGIIGLLEFDPELPQTSTLYTGGQMPDSRKRRYVYIPVNSRQAQRVYQAWVDENPLDPRPSATNMTDLENMQFPPPFYDAFVILSVGPDPVGGTGGILPPGLASIPGNYPNPEFAYHILGIVAYNLATRDANDNSVLDFDFRARTRDGEGKFPGNEALPNGSLRAGPLILKYP